MRTWTKNKACLLFLCILLICGNSFAETLSFPLQTPVGTSSETPVLSGDFESILMIDAKDGLLLYSANEGESFSPSGIGVSLMTAYIAANTLDMDEMIEVGNAEDDFPSGRAIGLSSDSIMTVRDLIAAVIFYGAQDAAAVLAYKIDGRISDFVDRMNTQAQSLGMTNTSYENPFGAYERSQTTTAQDLSILVHAAVQNEQIRQLISSYSYTFATENANVPATVESRIVLMDSSNEDYDPRLCGIGLGMTSSGGTNVILTAADGEREVLLVMHASSGSADYTADALSLINYAFDGFAIVDVATLASQAAAVYAMDIAGDGSNEMVGFGISDVAISIPTVVTMSENDNMIIDNMGINVKEMLSTSQMPVAGESIANAALMYNGIEIASMTLTMTAENAEDAAQAAADLTSNTSPDPDEVVKSDFKIYTNSDWQPKDSTSFMTQFGWIVYVVGAAVVAIVILLVAYLAQRRR